MRKYYQSENGYIEKAEWEPECWINIECPDATDFDFLRDDLGVPDSFLESAADGDERPRFDTEDGWRLTIIRIPRRWDTDPVRYDTVTLAIITRDDILVTMSHNKTEMLDDFIKYSQKKHLVIANKPDFTLRLIYSSTYWYLNYLKEINYTITSSFDDLHTKVRNEDLYNYMLLQKSLVLFNTSLRGNMSLVEHIDKSCNTERCDVELLEDVEIEMKQAQNTVNVYTEILDSMMDTLSSVISNTVNEIMKKMTSVSIILMLPTLIASFYGMNVAVAFADQTNAFWGIIGFSLVLSIVIYIVLKRINWL